MEDQAIKIVDACENNLKHINLNIPKGKLVVFAGVVPKFLTEISTTTK